MDRAFEAVEDVRRSAKCDLKRLVVGVSTNFTGFHVYSLGRVPEMEADGG